MTLLEVKELTKHFGGLTAVDRVSFMVEKGEIVGLIGPNGAGKTTLFDLLTGFVRASKGEVFFKSLDITRFVPSKIASLGIGRTFQLATYFGEMTVLQNVLVALHLRAIKEVPIQSQLIKTPRVREKEQQIFKAAHDILAFVGLTPSTNQKAKNLPHGFQKLLSIAMALATNPELLLLDEVVSGMNAKEIKDTITILREINKQGKTIIMIEHNMRVAMSLCERIIVLNSGRKIAEGLPKEIVSNDEVIAAYLGTGKEHAYRS